MKRQHSEPVPKPKKKAGPVQPVDKSPPPDEAALIRVALDKLKDRHDPVRVKVTQDDGRLTQIGPSHSDLEGWSARMMDAFGTCSTAFAISHLNRLIELARKDGEIDNTTVNALIAAVEGARPQNEIEAMLAVQMAGTSIAQWSLSADFTVPRISRRWRRTAPSRPSFSAPTRHRWRRWRSSVGAANRK